MGGGTVKLSTHPGNGLASLQPSIAMGILVQATINLIHHNLHGLTLSTTPSFPVLITSLMMLPALLAAATLADNTRNMRGADIASIYGYNFSLLDFFLSSNA